MSIPCLRQREDRQLLAEAAKLSGNVVLGPLR